MAVFGLERVTLVRAQLCLGIGLSRRYIVVDERDNVATAITDIVKCEAVEVNGENVTVLNEAKTPPFPIDQEANVSEELPPAFW